MTEIVKKIRSDLRLWLSIAGIIAAVVGYIVLIILVFIVPEVPIHIGFLMLMPTLIYLGLTRGSKKEFGPGCLIVIVLFIAGLALIGLGAAFQPEAFQSVLSSISE